MSTKGLLELSDGTRYEGTLFGAEAPVAGEVVCSTGMNGYPEALSDPTNAGVILTATFPIQGNYGMPSEERDPATGLMKYLESERLHPSAFVVHSYTDAYSHWNAVESLSEAMKRHGVTGLADIDTRELAAHLRDNGPLTGRILMEGQEEPTAVDPDEEKLFDRVSTREVVEYGAAGSLHVVVIDCGVKQAVLRRLLGLGLRVTRVPWDYDFTAIDCDGVLVSNGPGNPRLYPSLTRRLRTLLEEGKTPVMGIGVGSLLIALAIGADIRRLRYGHRGNQSVRRMGTSRCFIAPQNSSYDIVNGSLPAGWEPFFVNLDDDSTAGIISAESKCLAVSFDPEGCPGAEDTAFLFDEFVTMMKK